MRLEADDWRRFFDEFEREAFRLETLPSYGVPSEDDELREFLASGRLSIPDDDSWLTRVRHFRATGRRVSRVHVLRLPLSDYLRYEMSVYEHTVRAGEDVHILDLTGRPDADLPTDFWIFDDARVVRMDYAPDGRQLGREWLTDVDPAPYVAAKRTTTEQAVPFHVFRAMLDG